MVRTILPKKSTIELPIATDDVVATQLMHDPTVAQFPNSEYANQYQGFITQANPFIQNQPVMNVPQTPILTAPSETNSASNAEVLVENTNKDWINKRWRPAMGWMYMAVCIFDFILFPIMYTLVQFYETQAINDAFRQWQPLTLQGAGLFHLAMGAVLGIAAYGRTKEKIENKA
jgi:hypothetical protein